MLAFMARALLFFVVACFVLVLSVDTRSLPVSTRVGVSVLARRVTLSASVVGARVGDASAHAWYRVSG